MRNATLLRLLGAWAAVLVALWLLERLLAEPDAAFYQWLAGFGGLGTVLLVGERLLIGHWTASRLRVGALITNVALVGYPESTGKIAQRLASRIGRDLRIVAELNLGTDGVLDELAGLCRRADVDQLLLALPPAPDERVDKLLCGLQNFAINLQLVPELPSAPSPRFAPGEIGSIPAIAMINRPLTEPQCAVKRLEDLIFCSMILLAAGPLMALIAFLVKIDSSGPVLFRQMRWGYNFAPIEVLKFRTMYVAEAPDSAVMQARRDDVRVTRLGSWLRKTSLDELPQLFNVLRGDMSLVGPRPHAVPHNEHYSELIDNYLARHKLKPGMTGLAQVNGYRGITDTLEKMQKRVEFDLRYMENWSLRLDLRILAKTIIVAFTDPNAF
jgi:Undecaprenyl-phosphate glucose phosphotransferase